MQWRVEIGATEIEPNAQLDFYPDGTYERQPTPSLSAGDGFYLVYSNNARGGSGTVIRADSDTATIEISNTRWQLRRASGDVTPGARGMNPIVWLVGAKLP
jgi:hypothetical protein